MKIQHFDIFGQPIQVGDTIMTKSYGSTLNDHFATVKRISPKSMTVEIKKSYWNWGNYDYATKSYPNKQKIVEMVDMRRDPRECIKITQEMYDNIQASADAFRQQLLEATELAPMSNVKTESAYHNAIDEFDRIIGWNSCYSNDEEVRNKVKNLKEDFSNQYPEYAL